MSIRFQIVGSFLRPAELLRFKREIEGRDDIAYPFYADLAGYEERELEATKDVVKKQIERGLSILTDGEYTRSLWHLDFMWGMKGIRRFIGERGYVFRDKDESASFETRRDIGMEIVGTLSGKNHHFINNFKSLKSLAQGREVKFCIPSPSHIYGELSWFRNACAKGAVYETPAALKEGLLGAYRDFIGEFAAAGGKILQMDDCLWEIFADDNLSSPYAGKGVDQAKKTAMADEFVEINNEIISYGHDLGLAMWTHNCRGNYASRNMCDGSYLEIAELFLRRMNYDRFFLEWDDDRAGSLEALSVFKDKKTEIVLGLMSSKTRALDDEPRILRMLDEAARIIPKDRLYLSHQCGFASCDGGNELSEDEQWAKVDQGQRIARDYWNE
ncbi:MAG: cobalamin-independent methionine synthase II family protein [Treponema sp.]|nr:cobalamin-independent methionine synthase II family protein [Treponema sp.]